MTDKASDIAAGIDNKRLSLWRSPAMEVDKVSAVSLVDGSGNNGRGRRRRGGWCNARVQDSERLGLASGSAILALCEQVAMFC